MKTAKHENRKRLKGRQANRKLEKRDKKYLYLEYRKAA